MKKQDENPKIVVVASTKGGVGKSTISQHIVPYLLSKSAQTRVLEADTHNVSSEAVTSSRRLIFDSFKVRGKGVDDVVDETMLATIGDNLSTVIDAGAGDDSIETISAIAKIFHNFEVFIPLNPDFEHLQNAYSTALNVPEGIRKVLVFQNFTNMDEFWGIFGSIEYSIEQNLDFLKNFDETIEVPRSQLFGLSKLYKTTIYDISDISKSYDFEIEKREWAKGDREEFRKKMGRHRLSTACNEFLEAVAASRKAVSEWI